jgi:hypothetical protein
MNIYGTKGEIILVDMDDHVLLSRHNWYVDDKGYARTSIGSKVIKMHQLVCPCRRGFIIDHINRNKLDNRKENLRQVNIQISNHNRERNNDTGYFGVKRSTRKDCYEVSMSHNSKPIWIASGKDIHELAILRDYAAWKLRGDLALLNFPNTDYEKFDHPKKENIDEKIKRAYL